MVIDFLQKQSYSLNLKNLDFSLHIFLIYFLSFTYFLYLDFSIPFIITFLNHLHFVNLPFINIFYTFKNSYI